MNILYVYAHPNAASFNGMLKQRGCDFLIKEKHKIIFSDLYAEQFNAIASWDDFNLSETEINSQYFLSQQKAYQEHALTHDVEAEIEKIKQADHIIFQFPLWWFSTPAILKGCL
jgi:NAD(P)H dehydrogenase (quinone)